MFRYPILTKPKSNSFELFEEFDRLAGETFRKSSNYPPYNIYTDATDIPTIEMSVTGFSKEDLEVEYHADEGELLVKGTHTEENKDEGKSYSHRGLSTKNFTRIFTVNGNLEVDDIVMDKGLLTITFKRNEAKKISYIIK